MWSCMLVWCCALHNAVSNQRSLRDKVNRTGVEEYKNHAHIRKLSGPSTGSGPFLRASCARSETLSPSTGLGILSSSKDKKRACSIGHALFASKWLPIVDEFRNFLLSEDANNGLEQIKDFYHSHLRYSYCRSPRYLPSSTQSVFGNGMLDDNAVVKS